MNSGIPGIFLVGVSLTHIHPGSGRVPGVVDLPVMRDNLGYPIVMASSVKGALKSLCLRRNSEEKEKCKCLFGGEAGEGDKGAGTISILDLTILAVPIASASHGFLYVTTPYLLSRAISLGKILDHKYKKLFENILNAYKNLTGESNALGVGVNGEVLLQTIPITVEPLENDGVKKELREFSNILGEENPITGYFSERLIVLDDSTGVSVIEKALLKVTRIKLNRETKTVEAGGLWTEEYVPQGTIFITAVIYNGFRNEYCEGSDGETAINYLKELLNNTLYVFVGGKETVGKGLIAFRPLPTESPKKGGS